jgi:Zn-dependent protease with chaperone function
VNGRAQEPEQAAARAYGRARRRIGRAATAAQLVLVVLGALAGRRLADALDVPGPAIVDALTFTAVVGGAYELALLPFGLARYRLARRVGSSRQTVGGWLADRAKGGALALALGTPAVAAVVWLARVEPRWWWAIAVAAAVAVELLLTAVAPVLLVPIFLRSRPLAEGALRDELLALAARAGVPVGSVRVLEAGAKTAMANAAVMGMGPTRRIVLTDTLLDEAAGASDASIDEVRAVLGHELGHHRAGDLWRFAALGVISTLVSFGCAAWVVERLPDALAHGGPETLAGLPALGLCLGVVGLPLSLVHAAYSRRRERAADAFGFEVAGDPEAFARALERLCRTNLAELWPPRLTQLRASHPPPGERIARARA